MKRRTVAEAVLAAAVAVLAFQGLRAVLGDRYRVPTDSMEPTLHGDPDDGDVVFVDKVATAAERERGSLAVVRHPEHPGSFLVKRIAARGDDLDACWIDLRDGDVWLGADAQRLTRVQKEPLAALALAARWATFPELPQRLDLAAARGGDGRLELPDLAAAGGGGLDTLAERLCLELQDGRGRRRGGDGSRRPDGMVGTARDVDASFVSRDGAVHKGGEDQGVVDCGLAADFATLGECVVGAYSSVHEVVVWVWRPATGALQLWRDGKLVVAAASVRRDGPARVRFGRLDDRYWFAVDDAAAGLVVQPRDPAWDLDRRGFGGPRTHLHLGVAGGVAAVARLEVFRDLYSFRERIAGMPGQAGSWPRYVPPGHWFLLGDNAFDSRDSRHFDAVPTADFVGRPLAVIGPWTARRLLEAVW